MVHPTGSFDRLLCVAAGHHTEYETVQVIFGWTNHRLVYAAPVWRCRRCKHRKTQTVCYIHSTAH